MFSTQQSIYFIFFLYNIFIIYVLDEYTLWLAVPIFIISKVATLLWNFQDLLIILISMGLASRYHRLNIYLKYMVRHEKKYKDIKRVSVIACISQVKMECMQQKCEYWDGCPEWQEWINHEVKVGLSLGVPTTSWQTMQVAGGGSEWWYEGIVISRKSFTAKYISSEWLSAVVEG